MEDLVQKIANGQQGDTILMLEHNDVITAGTSARQEDFLESGIPLIQTGRGGKHTYHGPGQRVVYPLIDLRKEPWNMDLKRYLNFLHSWVISSLEEIGIKAHIRNDHIGVWVNDKGFDKKIAAMGIRARKWVSFHGFAINITTDLNQFRKIVPCGISDLGITSISDLGVSIEMKQFDEILKKQYYTEISKL